MDQQRNSAERKNIAGFSHRRLSDPHPLKAVYDCSFGGVGLEKLMHGFVTGETGPAAVLMFPGNLEWKSRQGLLIGGEWAYVKTQSPATPYTRYGAGLITRIRIEWGF